MPSQNRNARRTFTMLELLITLFIMGIMASALFAMLGSFSFRQQLDTSAFTLLNDLRQTQMCSLSMKDGYKYYGLRFYDSLGQNSDRQGWKILLYCTKSGGICTSDPAILPFNPTTTDFKVIKSSVSADNPDFLEDTFFNKRVAFSTDSEFQIGGVIVFNETGSATSDGQTLSNTKINLTLDQTKKTITITPLTGYVRIQ